VLISFFLVLAPLLADHPPASGAASSAEYVGTETCQACHDELYPSIADSAHRALLAKQEVPEQGCEACHGPGAAHVSSNGDKEKIFSFRSAAAGAIRHRCMRFHTMTEGQPHNRADVSCLSCHSVHQYKTRKFLLRQEGPALCQKCHLAERP
jgi:predicted CXXCH cytochrome family protein